MSTHSNTYEIEKTHDNLGTGIATRGAWRSPRRREGREERYVKAQWREAFRSGASRSGRGLGVLSRLVLSLQDGLSLLRRRLLGQILGLACAGRHLYAVHCTRRQIYLR